MCGACGSGVAAAPWETFILDAGPSARRLLGAALESHGSTSPWVRVKPNSFGLGYLLESRTGRRRVAESLDSAVDALALSAIPFAASVISVGTQAELAEALVAISRARQSGTEKTITLRRSGHTDTVIRLARGQVAVPPSR